MDLEISNIKKNKDNSSFSNNLENYIRSNNLKLSVDRFEGEFAICENLQTGEMIDIKKSLLPLNIKEGSILKYENGNYVLDFETTTQKQENIKNMVNNLFKKR